jgi:putative ferrous iron transport protein C
MLLDLQTYIAQQGNVSIADLSLHFHADSHTIQPMLAKLSRKGRIRKLPASGKCTGCTCCDGSHLEFYEWVGQRTYPGSD